MVYVWLILHKQITRLLVPSKTLKPYVATWCSVFVLLASWSCMASKSTEQSSQLHERYLHILVMEKSWKEYMYRSRNVAARISFQHTDWKKVFISKMNKIRECFYPIISYLVQITMSKSIRYCTKKYAIFSVDQQQKITSINIKTIALGNE